MTNRKRSKLKFQEFYKGVRYGKTCESQINASKMHTSCTYLTSDSNDRILYPTHSPIGSLRSQSVKHDINLHCHHTLINLIQFMNR